MPKISTSRSVIINASPDKIRSVIGDFHRWSPWSPWLITEPEARLNIAEDGKQYSWEGKRVGSGQMKVLSESDQSIDYDLIFLKPWKSKAKTRFEMKPEGDQTNVTWVMDSSLPFFMSFMKKKMETFIGMDYQRGLNMLKEYVENGKVNSKLEFLGEHDYEGCKFVGIKRDTAISKISQYMKEDFGNLMSFAQENADQMTGEWFSQYHKFDFVKDRVIYTAAVAVKDYPDSTPSGWLKSSIPASKFHTVRHVGPYDHIGNAWSASQSMLRAKEFKPKKGFHPIEFYRNSPQEVAPEELISDISFAVK